MPSPRTRPSPTAIATTLPALGVVVLALAWSATLPVLAQVLVAVLLVACVLSAVHHAEVVAHRVGEPLGSLILAVAVTVIEVGLIITLMLSATKGAESLARDTAFAALMITIHGIAGLVLLLGSLRGHIARFKPQWRRSRPCGGAEHRHVDPGAAEVLHQRARAGLCSLAAGFRSCRVRGALPDVRLHPERAPPRLLPTPRTDQRRQRTGNPMLDTVEVLSHRSFASLLKDAK